MSRLPRQRRSASIDVESLETRRLLVAFGTPWPDAHDLSISFPDDGVAVGRYENDINQTLDQVADRAQWQELALRAYQTWAIHADINVGLRNDYNLEFGAPGFMVNDPRFGEFRIGAIPQEGLLANSLPFQTIAGTYSGDLLLNSNELFTYHDWANDLGPDPATIEEGERDLFSLLLHEVGNTLGVEDNQMDWSVMFRQYTTPKGVLATEDIASIQDLYGARTDPYESTTNDGISTASLISTPTNFNVNEDVIRVRGSLAANTDVDVYELSPPVGQDAATIRLNASSISLLQSKLEVLDANGQVLDSASAQTVFSNDNEVQISGLQSHSVVYVRVSPVDASDIYAVGDYELSVDYRDAATRSLDPVAGAYDSGAEAVFANFDLADAEIDGNDVLADATLLAPTQYDPSRFEKLASVSTADDVDLFKITAPSNDSTRLVVVVGGVGVDTAGLRVNVVDGSGQAVGAKGHLRADGTWVMEVTQPDANAEYVIRVSVDPNSAVSVGNYVVMAEFEAPSSQMNELATGEVDNTVDEFIQWTAPVTKLYRFDLNADATNDADGVQLSIYDAHTREIRMVLRAASGETRSTLSWLPQGDYILRFTAFSDDANTTATVSYSLLVEGLSDDQDEDDYNASEDPGFYSYDYDYVDPIYDYAYYFPEIYYDFEAYYDDEYEYNYDYGC